MRVCFLGFVAVSNSASLCLNGGLNDLPDAVFTTRWNYLVNGLIIILVILTGWECWWWDMRCPQANRSVSTAPRAVKSHTKAQILQQMSRNCSKPQLKLCFQTKWRRQSTGFANQSPDDCRGSLGPVKIHFSALNRWGAGAGTRQSDGEDIITLPGRYSKPHWLSSPWEVSERPPDADSWIKCRASWLLSSGLSIVNLFVTVEVRKKSILLVGF